MVKHRFAAALLALLTATAAHAGLKAKVDFDKTWHGPNDNIVAKVTITNESSRPILVPRWQVPKGEMTSDQFEVTRDGRLVAYIGKLAKRAAPGPGEFLTLRPGQSIRGRAELASHYDMADGGEYLVAYRMDLAEGLMIDELRRDEDELVSDAVAIWRDAPIPPDVDWNALNAPAAGAGSLSFTGNCEPSEQSAITTAVSNARGYSSNSLTYLTSSDWSAAGLRYTTWFGARDSGRYTTVKNHFSALYSAFDAAPITVDCSCNDNYYAYVYKNQHYKIYVCNAFWSAPPTGTDSKAGTLVHEMSHFDAVASTDDWAYGQSACKKLAKRASKAIDNADSHEYFAENTPSLN